MKLSTRSYLKVVFTSIAIIAGIVTFAHSANVTLRWDANVPAPEGYRVFARAGTQNYQYDLPLKQIDDTTCTLIGLNEGVTYHFVVRAYDGALESADSEEVSYTPAAVVPNQAPTAVAGQNQDVYEGESVTLDGSGSSDTDGTIDSYQWLQTGGAGISISNRSSVQASFTAPVVGLDGETFTFSLTVTDDYESSSVSNMTVRVLKSSSTDVDGDHVPDVLDLFPNDPNESADNDGDGTGNNQDPDDDNDGMTDVWEIAYGLDPLINDAELDADNDGLTNLDEFYADTNPASDPTNIAPDAPVIESVTQIDRVELTPVLVSGMYVDTDHDDHFQSQWQISTESDFSTLVLEETSQIQLTAYSVGEMVLDVDTAYYWRVRFIDDRNGASDWSQPSTFTTIAAESAGDPNYNGIPDAQEVGDSVDVNENGVADSLEDNLMSVNTIEGQTIVGVEVISDNVTLVSVKSLATDLIPDQSVKMGFGLIGFKLYLENGVKTAVVKIHFSTRVPKDAQLYKYITDTGWEVYGNAVFAPNRKSVTMILEDGGMGDEDGVENGVIVDPSGIAYVDSMTSDSASLTTGGTSTGGSGLNQCFISAGIQDLGWLDSIYSSAAMLIAMTFMVAGISFVTASQINKNK
ncbi:choice-of-anchor U domain-containing protein [Desulfosarcina sp.]|uniref:fibronectin type III domain-containing protein n=1 Tax=Desulfosarcina sp. TaxID=2027861 RepID=UPI0029B04314|nr:choice-of-anchor U domain-containing protein [Desulfosarcina sp.]MDX2454767.1 PKD domain-containing protein [Desulfosarcina sp.]MDX2492371.1 PKD domain-containing protein [Desulfosarcina sp.]